MYGQWKTKLSRVRRHSLWRPQVEARKRYYWSVSVWDAKGQLSTSTEPAWWEMGLLDKSDWKAKWISWKNPEEKADWDSVR